MMKLVQNQPAASPPLVRLFSASRRLMHGGVFEGDVNGEHIRFYDPSGPDGYWEYFLDGKIYEHSVIVHLADIAKEFDSPTFLDVGAHYGYHTVYMSKLAGSSGRVYSFEPNRQYFRVLSTNVKLNDVGNAVLQQMALSDKRERIVLEVSERYRRSGHVSEKRKMRTLSPDSTVRDSVIAAPFDELAETNGISPDIVKIDVHGGEGKVIAGMKRTLRRCVSHVYCEIHKEMCDGYNSRYVLDTLRDAGMETYEFHSFRSQRGRLVAIRNELATPLEAMIYARKK